MYLFDEVKHFFRGNYFHKHSSKPSGQRVYEMMICLNIKIELSHAGRILVLGVSNYWIIVY